MRKNRRISVGLSVTRNLGNFNSVKPDASYGFDIADTDDLNEAYAEAWQVIEEQVSAKIAEALED